MAAIAAAAAATPAALAHVRPGTAKALRGVHPSGPPLPVPPSATSAGTGTSLPPLAGTGLLGSSAAAAASSAAAAARRAEADAALGIGVDDDDVGGGGVEEEEAVAMRAARAVEALPRRTRLLYDSARLSRPLVLTAPDDVSESLRPYARRDLLHSASRRIAAATAAGRVDTHTAGVAAAIVEWQATTRAATAAARADGPPEVAELLRDLEAGSGALPPGVGGGYSSGSPLAATAAATVATMAARRPASAGPLRNRAATASRVHVNAVLARYGDGALTGGGGDLVERFLFRRQVDLLAARNQTEVDRALGEWRASRSALDADIDARIAARRRLQSASLVTRMDYSGSVRAALGMGGGTVLADADPEVAAVIRRGVAAADPLRRGDDSEGKDAEIGIYDDDEDDGEFDGVVRSGRSGRSGEGKEDARSPAARTWTRGAFIRAAPTRLSDTGGGDRLPSPVVRSRPATAGARPVRPGGRASLLEWWEGARPGSGDAASGISGGVRPTSAAGWASSTTYGVDRPATKPTPGSSFVAAYTRPLTGSTAALPPPGAPPSALAPAVQPLEVLGAVATIRSRLAEEQRAEVDRVRAVLSARRDGTTPAGLDAVERALAPVAAVPRSLTVAALQAAGALPVATVPKGMLPGAATAAAGAAGGKAGAKGGSKPAAAAAAAAKGGKGGKGAAPPAPPKPFPGMGIGLLTGDTRPFSAGGGGGAPSLAFPENPLKVAARLQAIRDEVLGTGKKKKAGGGGGSPKKKKAAK